jgi:hypothetical protein
VGVTLAFDSGSTSLFASKVKVELPARGLAGMRAAVDAGARLLVAEASASRDGRAARVTATTKVNDLGAEAKIGPTAPFGRRLELGYHGVDTLGRSYKTPNPGAKGHRFMATASRHVGAELAEIFAASTSRALGV